MIQTVNFKGVFTIDEHMRVAVELTELDKLAKVYTCDVYKDNNNRTHMDLKEVKQA
jgi:hypothetical protein